MLRSILNKNNKSYFAAITLTVLIIPANVWSHAFGQRYDLPLPLSLYLWSAASVVALSFIVAALLLRDGKKEGAGTWILNISDNRFVRLMNSKPARRFIKFTSLFLFVLVLASGLVGKQDPAENIAPIFIWVIWWVGFAYMAAFFGNIWDLVNPWSALHKSLSLVFPRWDVPVVDYPPQLATWPAGVLFLIFAYLEFISGVAQHPATLAGLIIGYSLITLVGMRVFGGATWLRHGEAFTVVFGLMARFGLFYGNKHELRLRFPGIGLLAAQPVSFSLMAITLLMLTTVSFDGFIETPFWFSLNNSMYATLMSQKFIVDALSPMSVQKIILLGALILFYLLFSVVYLGVSAMVCRLSYTESNVYVTARAYVLSLVPIAIAYHLAHYLSYLLLSGQLIIPVLSDPLGLGWNLFGTRDYRVDISVIDAKNVWYLSVFAIVIGHVAAVCIAHLTAKNRELNIKDATISQLPMLVLMIAYTMISLWILSQPIIV